MNITDPIADLLTRIRNGQMAKHDVVTVPASKMKIAMVDIMKQEGYVRAYKCIRDEKQGKIKIALKYRENGEGILREIKRISKPGGRYYLNATKLPYVKNGYGVAILSTSQGIMTCRDARKRNIGGEYLCSIY